GARNGACAACLLFGHIGIYQRVHARILQRRERSVAKCLQYDDPDGRVKSDGGKQQQKKSQDQRIGYQDAAVADAGKKSRHDRLHSHGSDGLWHDEQTGLDRAEHETDLVQQWQEKRNATDSETGEEASAYRGTEGANGEEIKLQQRKWEMPGMNSISRKQHDGKRQQSRDLPHAQGMFSEYLQHIRQQRNAGT